MGESLGDRAQFAFRQATPEDQRWFMERLIVAVDSRGSRAARQAGLVVLAVALFELLAAGHGTSIDLGPLSVGRSDLVLVVLPPAIAYLLLDAVINTERRRDAARCYSAVFALWNHRAGEGELGHMALRERPLHWNIGSRVGDENMSRPHKVEDVVSTFLMLVLFVGVLVYEVRMFQYLAVELAIPVWQLLVSGAFVSAAVVAIGAVVTEDEAPSHAEASPTPDRSAKSTHKRRR